MVFIKLINKNNIDLISQFDKMDINNILGDIIMKKLFFATTISSTLILGACSGSVAKLEKYSYKLNNITPNYNVFIRKEELDYK